jgi:hypothetical protein
MVTPKKYLAEVEKRAMVSSRRACLRIPSQRRAADQTHQLETQQN